MSRTRKANKRTASHRHALTGSPRSSRTAANLLTAPAILNTPMDAAGKDTPVSAPAPDTPTPQDRHDHPENPDRRSRPNQAALKERAFALSCIGHRSPTIAAQLGVPERTIRHWISTTLLTLAQDATAPVPGAAGDAQPGGASNSGNATDDNDQPATPSRMERLRALAIERQLDIAVAARAAYDRLMAQHDHLLAQLTAVCDANIAACAAAADVSDPPPLPPAATLMTRLLPQLAASATRQLHLAQAAHREVARIQGVTAYAQIHARLAAEYDATQAQHDAAPAEDEYTLVPIQFINPDDDSGTPTHHVDTTTNANTRHTGGASGPFPRHRFSKADAAAAIEDIAGRVDDDDTAARPSRNPANHSGNTSGNESGNESGNDSGKISGNISD